MTSSSCVPGRLLNLHTISPTAIPCPGTTTTEQHMITSNPNHLHPTVRILCDYSRPGLGSGRTSVKVRRPCQRILRELYLSTHSQHLGQIVVLHEPTKAFCFHFMALAPISTVWEPILVHSSLNVSFHLRIHMNRVFGTVHMDYHSKWRTLIKP